MKRVNLFSMNLRLKLIVILTIFYSILVMSQEELKHDTIKRKSLKITSLAFGGTGCLITNINKQLVLMNGGRGSAIFNYRYTFGGGGWGMPQGIELERSRKDTFEFLKFGYGGLEFGYILFSDKKFIMGTNLLIAYGAGFKETVPKTKTGNFKTFPVFEPSLYTQLSLGKLLKLNIGGTYRLITGKNFSYISNQKLSGFSCYIVLLVGTSKCN